MHEKLKQHIDNLFASAPATEAARELREEMLQNLTDKYNDLIAQGKSEQEAYAQAVSSIGDISDLIGGGEGQRDYPAPPRAQRVVVPHKQRKGWVTAIAVALYVLSIVPVFFAGSTGVVMMFALMAAATSLLIVNRTNVHSMRAVLTAAGVALFITCPMANVAVQNVPGVILMFVMIGAGVGLVVYGQSEQFAWKAEDADDMSLPTDQMDARDASERRTRIIGISAIFAVLGILVVLSAILNPVGRRGHWAVHGVDGEVIIGGADGPTSILIDGEAEEIIEDRIENSIESAFGGNHDDDRDDRDDHDDHDDDDGRKQEKTAANFVVGSSAQIPAADLHDLEIDWISGSVELVVYDGADIEISETSEQTLSDTQKMRYGISKNTLHISYCAETQSVWDWLDIGALNMPAKHLTVRIPASMAQTGEIEINSVSSEVDAENVRVQELEIVSISGDIALTQIDARKLNVETTNGRIDLTNVNATELDMELVSGEAVAANVSVDSLELETTSGNFEIGLANVPGKLEVKTISGDCTLHLPAAATDFAVQAETVSGNVDCDFPSVLKNGLYVVGNGARIYEFESVSGDLRIRMG